ncbi:hypothetical protein FBUS_07511 [Fasciolopsis buskii]|uniref:Uncharacterized protein n=1 Tax=Fasciolopsis buskii TaxID=27845 RepID=A0A8E0RX47_9TREM|nr:hypothetical protein FBUS_07511 [Fasciolopsis buski]
MSTAFLSPDVNAIDNHTLINAYLGQCNNESMPIQSPLEVYRANIRLAQLIIEMLGINELQYAYKLASSLGHHIVSRLAQGCGAQEDIKHHQNRFDYLNTNNLPNQSYSVSYGICVFHGWKEDPK